VEVSAELGRATAYSRHLEEEVAAKAGELEARGTELVRLTAELEKAGAYGRRLEAELAGTESHARQLDQAVAELRRDLAASGARVTEQEQMAADLRRIVDDNTSYVRHLERELQRRVGDIAIRDDEMSVLRVHVEKTERAIVDRESQLAQLQSAADQLGHLLDARNLHVAEIEAYVRHLEGELQARAADIATSERAIAGARVALDEQQALAAHLSWVVQQPRHRLADASADALVSGAPWLHRVLRPLVMSLLERWSRPAPPR
jgi:chromosome segregation ATPase